MSEINDGGPAFPAIYAQSRTGMSLRDWFATHAPTASEAEIEVHYKLDRGRNPCNDAGKPPIRSRAEIVSYLNYKYADAVLVARTKAGGS